MPNNKFIIDLNNPSKYQDDKSSSDDELTIPKNDNKQVRLKYFEINFVFYNTVSVSIKNKNFFKIKFYSVY